jgi:membrane fusion protein, copper/silver efflux system
MTPAKYAVGIFLAAGIFLAGYVANRHPVPVATSASAGQAIRYTCPMHPQYQSDHAGECPICGMRLEPADSGASRAKPGPGSAYIPGAVQIGAASRQVIGVRTDEVRRAPASHLLRVPGRIAVDEGRLYRIVAGADGWVRELGQNTPGSFVKKGDLLAAYYTSNLLASTQTLVYAIATNEQQPQAAIGPVRGPTNLSLQIAVDSLRSLGMSDRQIDEIRQKRVAAQKIDIYSPITGFILSRNLSPEQRFDKGTELYRIADISHIWVMTDIFEKDREFLKPGAKATVHYQGRELQAHMSDALPQFDPQSRTLKTRFELDNPGLMLRPDMFVDVELHVETPAAITVPADSVIDLGRRKTVYVESAGETIEPRTIETGWRLGDVVQVTSGLMPGERIVVSSNFLVDSESRMRTAALGTAATTSEKVKDPVCGMSVDPNGKTTIKKNIGGKTWYFCSDDCRKSFEENPAKYVHEMAAQDGSGARKIQ